MKKNHFSSLLVLLVFALLCTSALFVLLTGADVVKRLNARDQESFNARTAVQYIATRVRQADARGMVSVRSVGDRSVLVLSEEIEQERYETLVYSDAGFLCELFVEAGLNLDLEFGERILPLQAALFRDEGTHIRAQLTMDDGSEHRILLALRSERGMGE